MIAKLSSALMVCTLLTHSAAGVSGQESDVVSDEADHTKPVKVYVMLGQSNMLGFGRVGPKETIGSLEVMVKEKGKYSHLVDAAGNWITRTDVRYVHVMDQRGVDYKNMEVCLTRESRPPLQS